MELYVIKNSAIDGQGTFAKRSIAAKAVVGLAFIHQHETGNPDTDYTRTTLGALTNHSDTPNMQLAVDGKNMYFVAVNAIEPDTELTIDYRKFDWEGKVNFTPSTKKG